MPTQKTLAIIKPDAVADGHIGPIIKAIEMRGMRPTKLLMVRFEQSLAEDFYAEHRGKAFFPELIAFTCSGPCVVMVLEGEEAVARLRALMGPTNPAAADLSTIRGSFGMGMPNNAIHGSATQADFEREMELLFYRGQGDVERFTLC